MVTQYPHTVTVTTAGNSIQDSEGNYQAGAPSSFEFSGRYESNTRNLFLPAADGKQIIYSGIIYCPYSTPNLKTGSSIDVKNGDDQVSKGKVLYFSRGQLNVKVWI